MITVHTNQGTRNLAGTEATILEMLEKEHIKVESHCRQGYCGACRVKVQGDVEYTTEPLGFHRKGEVLACCSKPKSSLEIDVRNV